MGDKMDSRFRELLDQRCHPQRASLTAEMHSRKLPLFQAPARLVQFVMLCDDDEIMRTNAPVIAACAGLQNPPGPLDRHFIVPLAGGSLTFERHTEFATYTFLTEGAFHEPFENDPGDADLLRWVDMMPGKIIRSTRIALINVGMMAEGGIDPPRYFSVKDIISCDIANRRAQFWSDFRMHDGFGRVLIIDKGLGPAEASAIIQTVQELGNYRKLALLGLPIARQNLANVSRIERGLVDLSVALEAGSTPDEDLLQAISGLSAELARLMAATGYRMSASHAYAQLSQERVESLCVGNESGSSTLMAFSQRRLAPAMRTCASFALRLEELSRRLSWLSALSRTRVDTALAKQNRNLLESMDRRNEIQLRLQKAVEGLSVLAMTYYLVGLVSHLAKGPFKHFLRVEPEIVAGMVVLPALIGFYVSLHNWKKRLDKLPPSDCG
jgi:uncharacterized membrane-anchored protein